MNNSLISKEDIERLKFDEQIVKETAYQVIKDFAVFGIDIIFPENNNYAYDELFQQLKVYIEQLIISKPEKLSSLLYHIDLDENKLRESQIELFHEHEWISEMILEREFLKVLTRHYFRNNK